MVNTPQTYSITSHTKSETIDFTTTSHCKGFLEIFLDTTQFFLFRTQPTTIQFFDGGVSQENNIQIFGIRNVRHDFFVQLMGLGPSLGLFVRKANRWVIASAIVISALWLVEYNI
jgi:hypothetical protein